MAKIEWIEQRLQNWARWRLTRGSGVVGYAAVNLADPMLGVHREPYADAPVPTNGIEAGETDSAVRALPGELRATVECYYLSPCTENEKLRRLCVAKRTMHDRVHRAQQLIAAHFTERQAAAGAERARVEALQASVRPA